ncbi:MAG: hypothetical protein ABH879_07385 [archaeon]
MKKDEYKPIRYNTVIKNKTLGDFIKEEVIDRTLGIAKFTRDLVIKWTKK